MVAYSYFIFHLLQTVANGFNLLQARDSARFDPRACCKLLQTVASCFNRLQNPDASDLSPLQPMRSIVFSLRPDIAIRPAFHVRAPQ